MKRREREREKKLNPDEHQQELDKQQLKNNSLLFFIIFETKLI